MNTNLALVISTAAPACRGRRFFCLGIFILLWASGCKDTSAPDHEMVVFAPSSMIDVLPEIARAWEDAGNPTIRLRFDATSRLARQIEYGAPADLFISADRRWMDNLIQSENIIPKSITPIARNTLVAITHRSNTLVATGASHLRNERISRIVLAGPQVPVGRYARQALQDHGVLASLKSKIIAGTNARHVLALVERREGDIGFVYASDARSSHEIRVLFSLAPNPEHPIEYLGGVVSGGDKRSESFLQFVQSDKAEKVLIGAGFFKTERGNP